MTHWGEVVLVLSAAVLVLVLELRRSMPRVRVWGAGGTSTSTITIRPLRRDSLHLRLAMVHNGHALSARRFVVSAVLCVRTERDCRESLEGSCP